jgi:hypothetical protein
MSHNPYTPPSTPVTDHQPAALPTPWQVKAAVWLIWISLAIGAVSITLGPDDPELGEFRDLGEAFLLLIALVVAGLVVVVALLSYFILRAHRWARIVYAALVVLGLLNEIGGLMDGLPQGWVDSVIYLLSISVDVSSIVLLFTPPANAWFAKRRAAAQG